MARTSPKSPSFYMSRVLSRGRARTLGIESTPINADQAVELFHEHSDLEANVGNGRKLMIVVDPSLEAKVAIQWAFSHSIQNKDIVVLLHVAKPSKRGGETHREAHPREYELLCNARNMCHSRNPEVQVEVALVEGGEKGLTILEEAKGQGISLIVLGQRNRSITWWLLLRWARGRMNGRIVEYCIKNADCMTLAVRRNEKLGGYLITTKRHKDFWLLA